MKEALCVAGDMIGVALAIFGLIIFFGFRADNSDADALAGAVRLFVGIPCLVIGALLLVLCTWGLRG